MKEELKELIRKNLSKLRYTCEVDLISGLLADSICQWIAERIPEDDKDVPCDEVEEDSPEYNRAIAWNNALKLVRERLGV